MSRSAPLLLLVDDERVIAANLGAFLERLGFAVLLAEDGRVAVELVRAHAPDLVVLDVMMPRCDGRAALRELRQSGDWTPVILLTQVGNSTERALAIEEGADDYLNKPFDPYELVARIRALLRRASPGKSPLAVAQRLRCGSLVTDRSARRAWLAGKELALTPKAFALLDYLMTHPDELLSRERLLDAVWGWEHPSGTRAVDARIAELRRALAEDATQPQFIETLAGQGYRFAAAVERA